MRTALIPLRPADLSAQEGCYYCGTAPGGQMKNLWAYSHRTDPKNKAPLYWFSDCMQPADTDDFLVPFSAVEVGEYLSRV